MNFLVCNDAKVYYNVSMIKKCTLENCEEDFLAKGYCSKHYRTFMRYGDPYKTSFGFRYQSEHPLYYTWRTMRTRCNWKKYPRWPDYGGRGIKVCERWNGKYGFINFLEDMGDKPSEDHQLDRIDNDGDYTIDNCRWATRSENQMNKRKMKNNTSGFTGITPYVNNRGKHYWRARVGSKTIGYYETFDEAVSARLFGEDNYKNKERYDGNK